MFKSRCLKKKKKKNEERKRVLSLERHTVVSLRMQLPMGEIFRTDDYRTNLCTQRNVDSVEQTHNAQKRKKRKKKIRIRKPQSKWTAFINWSLAKCKTYYPDVITL